MTLQFGSVLLENRLLVAPMAGVTDRPFRNLCRAFGAGYAVSEMMASRKDLWHSPKTARRADHTGEQGPIAVQIAGTDPAMMAEAARYNIDLGAQVIDINMGCPAKKVCNQSAGSALMRDEPLAVEIAQAVVKAATASNVPVTLKMRTGWDASHRNAVALARRFEAVGVQMLTVHGRTREQGYSGQAEYDTIAAVKAAVRIPVVANGDIDSPEKAREVLASPGADAVMIGRAAQGRPWIFGEIAHFLETGTRCPPPKVALVRQRLGDHLREHYALYGPASGVRSARKHIGWYVRGLPGGEALRRATNAIEDCERQWRVVDAFFEWLGTQTERMPGFDVQDCPDEEQTWKRQPTAPLAS